ncbi:MAG TPA: thiamine-phosphate kinase [Bacteroidota bacterium]|nr:thiamine-phosphate kinase [Bacteroidota bacterium]
MIKHTDISTLGEIGLIERVRQIVDIRVDDATIHERLILGISDDTAVFRPDPGKVMLLTTDSFIEGVHFDLTFTSLRHLGWKAMAANLSDIAAMGGSPRYAVVSLSLPKKVSIEMVDEFYAGAIAACKRYSFLIVGGDMSASMGNIAITVALTGEAKEEQVLYRKTAKPGDLLCVSGHLGASHAGLKVLQREKQRYHDAPDPATFKPNLEQYTLALEKHLMPKPRFDISALLAGRVTTHAAIDISDGLASEVHRICTASGVGAKVYEHNIPLDSVTRNIAIEFSESPTDYALFGGEEYELLFTMEDAEFEKLESLTSDATIIGRITEQSEGIRLVKESGEEEELKAIGWRHF